MNLRTAPIGVFDSGVGGLSVLHHLRQQLPHEHLMYVADSGFAPYGERSAEWIAQRSRMIADFLISEGAKALVIACNTATAAGAAAVRAACGLPVIGMEPAVKPAVAATRSGVIGILATTGTLNSARFAALLDHHAGDVEVLTQPCTGWVDAVERGELDSPTTEALVRHHVGPLLHAGADVLVLGCTHYPFLRPVIERVATSMGKPQIKVVDTGSAVARQCARRLAEADLLNPLTQPGQDTLWSSGNLQQASRAFSALWQSDAVVQALPALPFPD